MGSRLEDLFSGDTFRRVGLSASPVLREGDRLQCKKKKDSC